MKVLLCISLFLSLSLLHANTPEIAGPLTGDVRANQVTLWMYAPIKSKCTFSYRAEGSSKDRCKDGRTYCPIQPSSKGPRANIKINRGRSVT